MTSRSSLSEKELKAETIEFRKNMRMRFIPSFGRRKSRGFTEKQKELFREFFPKVKFELKDIDSPKFAEMQQKPIYFEIGFGDGEHLVHLAKTNPDKHIIGSEIFQNGIATCLNKAKDEDLDNLHIFIDDSRYLLEKFPEGSLERLYILFPDPWPKKKQFKRRIVNKQTLDLAHKALKEGGIIRLATDHVEYFSWMLDVMDKDNRYKKLTPDSEHGKFPDNHIITKYQKFGLSEGRSPNFLEYKKV